MLRHFSFLIRENHRRGSQLGGLGVRRQVGATCRHRMLADFPLLIAVSQHAGETLSARLDRFHRLHHKQRENHRNPPIPVRCCTAGADLLVLSCIS